jgi:hypothetical protein
MSSIEKEISKARHRLKKSSVDKLLLQKPFGIGMYFFTMFMMNYYSRVREKLKIDYDSFMIILTTSSHTLYQLNKTRKKSSSYEELESLWEQEIKKQALLTDLLDIYYKNQSNESKLTVSSICLVLGLPKETVRRKVSILSKKNLLKTSHKQGIILGPMYKDVFQKFVPKTVLELSKMLKNWQKTGALKSLLEFKLEN